TAWSALCPRTVPATTLFPSTGDNEVSAGAIFLPATTLTLKSSTPADGSNVAVGAMVTIVVTETNTGTTSLTGVNVTGGDKCASFTGGATTLAAGASTDFTCTFTATAGATFWFADGHGTHQFGNPAPSAGENNPPSATAPVTP